LGRGHGWILFETARWLMPHRASAKVRAAKQRAKWSSMRLRSVSEVFQDAPENPIPVHMVAEDRASAFLEALDAPKARWLKLQGFKGQAGKLILVPGPDGGLAEAVLGLGDGTDPLASGHAPLTLPEGDYSLAVHGANIAPDDLALGWAMGSYKFDEYKSAPPKAKNLRLVWPEGANRKRVLAAAEAIWTARDWIAMPASDMSPAGLEAAARAIAARHGATVEAVTGGALLDRNYPLIHAVGRAAAVPPRLIKIEWGKKKHKKLALVGKGVCFDTGGLDLKAAANMLMMRKDMGGAASVLGLAHMIMSANWPVQLSVYVPAVENSVSGDAFRPGDVIKSRKGLTVEIGNTDAEGRLVLADALAQACEDGAETVICMATLTGAARTATGFELPPFFTNDDAFATSVQAAAMRVADPMWRLPLWRPYNALIEGKSADLNNSPDSPNGGAITAALFLNKFVDAKTRFLHADIAAWTDRAKAGRPVGAEPNGMRALFAALESIYGA
jgi:leucyl aminopeptidase